MVSIEGDVAMSGEYLKVPMDQAAAYAGSSRDVVMLVPL